MEKITTLLASLTLPFAGGFIGSLATGAAIVLGTPHLPSLASVRRIGFSPRFGLFFISPWVLLDEPAMKSHQPIFSSYPYQSGNNY